MISKEMTMKMLKISDDIQEIVTDIEMMSNGDYQAAIEAQILIAIQYGYELAKKGEK